MQPDICPFWSGRWANRIFGGTGEASPIWRGFSCFWRLASIAGARGAPRLLATVPVGYGSSSVPRRLFPLFYKVIEPLPTPWAGQVKATRTSTWTLFPTCCRPCASTRGLHPWRVHGALVRRDAIRASFGKAEIAGLRSCRLLSPSDRWGVLCTSCEWKRRRGGQGRRSSPPPPRRPACAGERPDPSGRGNEERPARGRRPPRTAPWRRGTATRFICGYFACDRRASRALLGYLPPMLRIELGDIALGGWLADLLRLGRISLARRRRGPSRCLRNSPSWRSPKPKGLRAIQRPDLKGWLAGLQDPFVGRALALLHGQPMRDWSVDELAREVALSRSALAERFNRMIGEPPMQYLTRWRLTLAAQALCSGNDAIAKVAERSGYESEASFTRAFKREFGVPPTVWRRVGGGDPTDFVGRPRSA